MAETPNAPPSAPPSTSHQKNLLLGYIRQVVAALEQVAEANADKAEVKKSAKAAGFDPVNVERHARRLMKIDKLGRDKVLEDESLWESYRDVVEGKGKDFDDMMDDARDRALLKIFAPNPELAPKPPTLRQRAASEALAYAEVSRMNRGGV